MGPVINDNAAADVAWPQPDPLMLADGPHKQEVLYGEALIRRTYAFVGPDVADANMRYAGNNLACGSCHLDGGRRRYGLSFIGVANARRSRRAALGSRRRPGARR
jgi:thiosulfate dehydrogenase